VPLLDFSDKGRILTLPQGVGCGRAGVRLNLLVWDDLRVFLALARNPSIRTAAGTLNIDPTTLIRRLTRLSEALQTTLFEKRQGYYHLTEHGYQFLGSIEKVEATILEGIDVSASDAVSGVIRIAAPESLATWFLAPLLPDFQKAHPRVSVDLITPSWVPDPLKREVDVAILIDRPVRGALTARKLVEANLRLYASESYLESHPPIKSVDDLAGHSYIGYVRGMSASSQALEYTMQPLPGLVASVRTTSMAVIANMVAEGKGIAMLPHYAGIRIPSARVVCPDEVCVPQSFWLVVREDVRQSPRVVAFIDWLSDLVRAHKVFFQDR